MFLAGDLQNGLGHGFRGPGFFQQGPGHRPQGNDQADIRHRSSHAICKGLQHRLHAHAGHNGKDKGRGNQGKERVKLQFDSTDHQGQHRKDQPGNHRKCAIHGNPSFPLGEQTLFFQIGIQIFFVNG